MTEFTWREVSEKVKLSERELIQIVKHHKLPINEDITTNLSTTEYLLLLKIIKLLSQNLSEEKINTRVHKLLNAKKTNVTISDVALEAGVSISSVSTILNNRVSNIKVSQSTRTRIKRAAKRLEYKPNKFASALRTKQTGVIGAIVRDIGDPFLRQIVQELQVVCQDYGLDLLLSHAMHEAATAQRQVTKMMDLWFDGFIFVGDMVGDGIIFDDLSNHPLPAVSLAGRKRKGISTISYDDDRGTELMFKHLLDMGHRSIAFVGNILHTSVKNRLDTLKRLQLEAQIPNTNVSYFTPTNLSEVYINTMEMLNSKHPPTAIFCTSDIYAQTAVNTALQLGWGVPEDITIVGYDCITELKDFFIPLTTVCQPTLPAARAAIKNLTEQIQANLMGKSIKPVNIIIEPKLVVRKSSGPPR